MNVCFLVFDAPLLFIYKNTKYFLFRHFLLKNFLNQDFYLLGLFFYIIFRGIDEAVVVTLLTKWKYISIKLSILPSVITSRHT